MKRGQKVKVVLLDEDMESKGLRIGHEGVIVKVGEIFQLVRMELTKKELWIPIYYLKKVSPPHQTELEQRAKNEFPDHHFQGGKSLVAGKGSRVKIAPMHIAVESVTFSGPATILKYMDSYGRPRKAIARCSPRDVFDPNTGLAIAALRAAQVVIGQIVDAIGNGKFDAARCVHSEIPEILIPRRSQ